MEPSAGLAKPDQDASAPALPTLFQQYVHMTHYSRWRDDLGRREFWHETAQRYVDWATSQCGKVGYDLTEEEQATIRLAIVGTEAMPSMRLMMTAGEAEIGRAHV